jgi:hypothetical protein
MTDSETVTERCPFCDAEISDPGDRRCPGCGQLLC